MTIDDWKVRSLLSESSSKMPRAAVSQSLMTRDDQQHLHHSTRLTKDNESSDTGSCTLPIDLEAKILSSDLAASLGNLELQEEEEEAWAISSKQRAPKRRLEDRAEPGQIGIYVPENIKRNRRNASSILASYDSFKTPRHESRGTAISREELPASGSGNSTIQNATNTSWPAKEAVNADLIDLTSDTELYQSRRQSQISTLSDDLDDTTDLESDDEVQITGFRKCPRAKKRKRVRQVLDLHRETLNSITVNFVNITRETCVEFNDGVFMKVYAIYADQRHQYILVGQIFTRIAKMETLMPRQRDSLFDWRPTEKLVGRLPRYHKGSKLLNEVCQRVRTPAGEAEQDEGMWRRSAQDVIRRRELKITNNDYENMCKTNCDVDVLGLDDKARKRRIRRVKREDPLTCRWRETIIHDEYGKVKEHRLERPLNSQVLCDNSLVAEESSRAWRGPTRNVALPNVKLEMLDAFCGCGGMSSAAVDANIKLKMAFDHDPKKVATHSLNFPNCQTSQMSVTDWIEWAQNKDVKVEIVHISPPCQPFSQANTTPNITKNEKNQAALLACGELVKLTRPRIVTVEESDGILGRHTWWFDALVHQFTELGFSIRWATLSCSEFGVPQLRKRVFVIASAPGEELPPFPKPTHLPGSVTIQSTLVAVEAAHRMRPLSHHDPESQNQLGHEPYDCQCLAKTVTCKGGENYHPSGRRQFTIREYLALQTFSNAFRFPATWNGRPSTTTEMRLQLGNAVPPLFGRAILESIMSSLRSYDKTKLARFGGDSEASAIEL